MTPKHFTLTRVKPAATGTRLHLHFADGELFELDLGELIRRHPTLAPLKQAQVFRSAKLADQGRTVCWAGNDDLELAADNLRARAVEQAGGISHEFIWNWMARHELTLDAAAEALGVSRRMLAYYRSGAKPVPRTVALACLGWEAAAQSGGNALRAA